MFFMEKQAKLSVDYSKISTLIRLLIILHTWQENVYLMHEKSQEHLSVTGKVCAQSTG